MLKLFQSYWEKDSLNCFVGSRYACVPSGIILSYPGTPTTPDYDCRTRYWFVIFLKLQIEVLFISYLGKL